MSKVILQKPTVTQQDKKSPTITETEGSLSCLKEPVTLPFLNQMNPVHRSWT